MHADLINLPSREKWGRPFYCIPCFIFIIMFYSSLASLICLCLSVLYCFALVFSFCFASLCSFWPEAKRVAASQSTMRGSHPNKQQHSHTHTHTQKLPFLFLRGECCPFARLRFSGLNHINEFSFGHVFSVFFICL